MIIRFIGAEINYDGSQLAPHWIYRNSGIIGDAFVSFIGSCSIPFENMVDIEDVLQKSPIYSKKMLHFIGEFFSMRIREGVLLQRLLSATVLEQLVVATGKNLLNPVRIGDDIFINDAKLSISIATVSAVSSLVHFGINIDSTDTPVKTVGLDDIGVEPQQFANIILEKFEKEMDSINRACWKVKPL